MEAERRRKARLYHSLPLSVRGSEASGKAYRFETITPNIGAGGLCAFAPRIMKIGERISMRVRFARIGSKLLQAPEISIRGQVVRVEERAAGYCLFAVSFLLRRVA
jgi:hypothetical protein